MKQERFLLILSRVLIGLALLVVLLGVLGALSVANGTHGITPAIYALGGPELGNLITGLIRPLLNGLSVLVGVGGLLLGLLLFTLGQVARHVHSLAQKIKTLEQAIAQQNSETRQEIPSS